MSNTDTTTTSTQLRHDLIAPRQRKVRELMVWQREMLDHIGKFFDTFPEMVKGENPDAERQYIHKLAYSATRDFYIAEIRRIDAEIELLEEAEATR